MLEKCQGAVLCHTRESSADILCDYWAGKCAVPATCDFSRK